MKPITRVWTFPSDSNPSTEYQTLHYSDGSTSCNCKGWTKRTAQDGSRSCKHTRLVDSKRKVSNEMSLKEAVIKVLGKQMMTKEDILAGVQKLGYRFRTSKPIGTVTVVLYGKNPKFKRLDGGGGMTGGFQSFIRLGSALHLPVFSVIESGPKLSKIGSRTSVNCDKHQKQPQPRYA